MDNEEPTKKRVYIKYVTFIPLIVSIVFNVYFGSKVTNLTNECNLANEEKAEAENQKKKAEEELQTQKGKAYGLYIENNDLQSELISTQAKLDWYMQNAVCVTETGSKYHLADCYHISGRDYYIYNVENAEYQGYEPCSDCYKKYFAD